MTFDEVVAVVGAATAERLRELTLAVYTRGAQTAAANGILVADTKLEFGLDAGGHDRPRRRGAHAGLVAVLAGRPVGAGRPQFSFDKQYVRDWSATLDWDRTPPGPEVPPDVVAATRARYVEVYERITGRAWHGP